MNTQNRKPRWRQLSLLIPLMMGLLLIDGHMRLSTLGHQVSEVSIILLMYGSLACWLWSNQAALESESDQDGSWQRLATVQGEPQNKVTLPAWVETAEEHDQLTERPSPTPAFQPVLYRQDVRCTPPSGARLN